MANQSNISMSLDPDIIEDIAAEMGISSAFVEKDWYAVQALKALAEHESDGFQAIFSGGTSLSKGYGLIQRFSEDLDFRCLALRSGSAGQMRKLRRAYRGGILGAVESVDVLVLDRDQVTVASNYVKFELGYPQNHDTSASLRAGLQIEFSFTQPRLEAEVRQVQSFVSYYTETEPEVEILCLPPIETAADKLSAWTWRVLKRDRSAHGDDPAMIRHLHDISALISVIRGDQELFVDVAESSFEGDRQTGKRDTQAPFTESIQEAIECLDNDEEYREEYRQFVDAMSYADDDESVDFDSAVDTLQEVAALFE